VTTPGTARYGHYLARGQFAAEFGPTPSTLAAIRSWLTSSGLQVGTTAADGLLVPVSCTVAQM
jgi:subtilase family serine protease